MACQWGTHPGHPKDKVNERAWKNYLRSLAAALLDGIFEHPANQLSDLYANPGVRDIVDRSMKGHESYMEVGTLYFRTMPVSNTQ